MKKRKSKYTFRVGKSTAGLGLFAESDIKKGDFLIEYTGKKISQEKADKQGGKYLFEINDTIVLDGSSRTNTARYINHSCAPNCESDVVLGKVYIYAIKKIKEGEELGYDYGKEYYNEHIKPFGCKCPKCIKKNINKSSKKRKKKAAR